jgi:solute carrier family 35 (adenosine 3'-phospho 5'-phosphosulfate transporter), member B3
LFRIPDLKEYGTFITFLQFLYYTIFASLEHVRVGMPARRIPMRTFSLLAFLTVSTMALSNSSLSYLNYPTQVARTALATLPQHV